MYDTLSSMREVVSYPGHVDGPGNEATNEVMP